MLSAGGDEVEPGGLDGGVAEHVGELGEIVGDFVERAGKEMPEVVRKDFAGFHVGKGAKIFHLAPDLLARKRGAIARDEERLAGDALAAAKFGELTGKLAGQEDGADLALEGDGRASLGGGFQGDVAQMVWRMSARRYLP